MFSAAKMRQKQAKNTKKLIAQEWKEIKRFVQCNVRFSCTHEIFFKKLFPENVDKLLKLGYTVEEYKVWDDWHTKIKWGEENG